MGDQKQEIDYLQKAESLASEGEKLLTSKVLSQGLDSFFNYKTISFYQFFIFSLYLNSVFFSIKIISRSNCCTSCS